MIREKWNEADITAYLDNQLPPKLKVAFETALVQNRELRQHVEALRKTRDLLRTIPLRESPRNYLLTPSMVAPPKPIQSSRRRSIGMMRLATSLTAAAFVLTMGLNVLSRGSAPAMFSDQTESLKLMRNGELPTGSLPEDVLKEEESPMSMLAAETPVQELDASQERTYPVEEPDMESEALMMDETVESIPEGETEVGTGGGGEPPQMLETSEADSEGEAAVLEGELKVAPAGEAEVVEDGGGESSVAPLPENTEELTAQVLDETPASSQPGDMAVGGTLESVKSVEDMVAEEGDVSPTAETGATEPLATPLTEAREASAEDESQTLWRFARVRLPGWIPVSLGLLTLLLFALTIIVSGRR